MTTPQNNAKKYRILLFILLSVIIICLVLPIVLEMLWLYAVIIVPIGVCVFGIHRATTTYRENNDIKNVFDCITVSEMSEIKEISAKLGFDDAKTRRIVEICFKNGYLNGYFRVGETIRKKEDGQDDVIAASSKKIPRRCNHCGAVANYYENEKAVCIYCGNIID